MIKTEKERTAIRALECLFLEVDVSIANDIKKKVLSAISELKEQLEVEEGMTFMYKRRWELLEKYHEKYVLKMAKKK